MQDSSESSQVSDEEYRQQHDREQYRYKLGQYALILSYVLVHLHPFLAGLGQKVGLGICGLDFF